jgi:UvrD-like helicase C-terminal domain/Nuclease-related domain/AAA domain
MLIDMATFIPTLNSCLARMTGGEKRLGRILDSHLDDEYLVWYNPLIGDLQWEPDFVILHPRRGLLVLEVKDWKIESIKSGSDRQKIVLNTPDGSKNTDNPLEQAKKYAFAIERLLRKDRDLVQDKGRYQGGLLFPYGHGAVLSNISRSVSEQMQLNDIIHPDLTIYKDELTEKTDVKQFQERLWKMFKHRFSCDMGLQQIDRVRFHLFPQLRHQTARLLEFQRQNLPKDVDPKSESLLSNGLLIDFDDSDFLPPVQPIDIPSDLIKLMDLDQEKIARNLGDGHRIIHGVAGSGKTMILLYRCEYLASLKPERPILVLCFNVTLAARLREIITSKGISHKLVEVIHFHEWVKLQMKKYRQPLPVYDENNKNSYLPELERRMTEALATGAIPSQQYSTVLIDEGHDLQPAWLQMLVRMPENESLLLLYDDAQNIYGNNHKQQFSFKSIGIKAQGRSSILRVNYRNTVEVLNLAYKFASEVMQATDGKDEDIPVLIEPQSAERHGSLPQIISQPNFAAEIQYLIQMTKRYQEQGIPWKEMAIIYYGYHHGTAINESFITANIPIEWITKDKKSRSYDSQSDRIKLVTMHSSKGLEFPVVMIPGVGSLPYPQQSPQGEARLLYVAMTRSTDKLLLTYNQESLFVKKLQTALNAG